MEVNEENYTLFTGGLDEEKVIEFGMYFPYQHLELNEGLNYLVLNIKPNCYGKANW
jgi:hypothetical protein